ncbi:MAG: FG-GAP-like repeat-containing protein [bacterium]
MVLAVCLSGGWLLAAAGPYACEDDLIEVMFAPASEVRLRDGALVDLKADALLGVESVLQRAGSATWQRICNVPEEKLDELQVRGEAKSGEPLYNLNNIYRVRIPKGNDVWKISAELEALPGIILARPVPKPMPSPNPISYQPQQNYEDPASSTPTGIDAEYAWTQSGGDGTGVTICDLEYGWNYDHLGISKLDASDQLNADTVHLPSGETDDHGTAVVGVLVSDNNGWGTTGIAYGADIKVCGTYYGPSASPAWNVPGALAIAIAALSAGDVIVIENQWDWSDPFTAHPDFIPIEWWLNYYPNGQSFNGVYAAIQTAVANGIHVVEAGGNGGAPHTYVGINTDAITWYGNSGAIIVGAGGAYPGGVRPAAPEGDLQKVDYSSYGSHYSLQGWGENVVTTGYSDLYSAEGKNLWYTAQFAGTSSATPVVAGAVACCVGYWKAKGHPVANLTPQLLRDILVNTGTAQIMPPNYHIGPRPDLQAAILQLSVEWTDVTPAVLEMGLDHTSGAAWGDYDNDGDEDLYVGNSGSPNYLFRNDSGTFVDVTSGPLGDAGFSHGLAWGDYDNDGCLDLYLSRSTVPNVLFHNECDGTFADSTHSPVDHSGTSTSTAWGDYDNDGDLDIYQVDAAGPNKLFNNDGGRFSDVTSGPEGDAGYGLSGVWGDYDNDGDLDIYLSNYNGQANHLFRNDGGSFTDVTSPPLDDAWYGLGASWADYDNDGDLDLYLCNSTSSNKLFRNDGGGSFTDVTAGPLGYTGSSYSGTWADYDNDMDLDLYLGNGSAANQLLRNDGSGTFTDVTQFVLADTGASIGVAWADYDNDGDLDIFLAEYFGGGGYHNRLIRNEAGHMKHWLQVKAIGTISNRASIGARVRVVAGGVSQIREICGGSAAYFSQSTLIAAFGLGDNTDVDTLQVTWPSGTVRTILSPAGDVLHTVYETQTYICGDANTDGVANITDAVYLIQYIFNGGPPPEPLESGDANCDGVANITDAVYLIQYIFGGGPDPCDPDDDGMPDC